VTTASWEVLPDITCPGGIVRSIPGLSAMNSVVVTSRSACVRTRPIAFAISEYARKNTRPWKSTDILSVVTFLNDTLVPFVLRSMPGLSARKRMDGIATFWEVSEGNI
tara:strand:- start:4573 stop:4896 length:324 start_codon:yes stop_codon:yes gene_type:complete